MSLAGKTIAITGATSGIGEGLARRFAAEKASVVIGGRRAEKGEALAKELGDNVTFVKVDTADEASNKAFFEAANAKLGGIDFVLLNAGVEGKGAETNVTNGEFKIDTYDYVFNVNVRGVLLGLNAATPFVNKNGRIVVTSSVVAIVPVESNCVYAASKAAVDSLVNSIAPQFANSADERIKSITLQTINPVVYSSEMVVRFTGGVEGAPDGFAAMFNPSGKLGLPSDIANTFVDLLNGKLTDYAHGAHILTDCDKHYPLSQYGELMAAKAAKAAAEQ
eukprot:TRINITY_DN2100_c0_g1_i1.p2 TRINITY_DN2100_c0_g1~~TRINITY_DN2100_c0_g1_i1.p2  ORF type:complete len:278 (+),score=138.49 TRINITY_DN2100_c0_g1_i1:124-957(+)